MAWIRSQQAKLQADVAKLTKAINQRQPSALPTYLPLKQVPYDERIVDLGGISLRTMRLMLQTGELSEAAGHLQNVSKGSRPTWLVNVPALVEKLKCDRNLD